MRIEKQVGVLDVLKIKELNSCNDVKVLGSELKFTNSLI